MTQTQHRKSRAKLYTNCSVCGKQKVVPATNYIARRIYEQDEYCSRACCEKAQRGA